MRRLGVLLGVLVLVGGCSGDGRRGQWDDFWKDLRGDNMQMRSGMRSPLDDGDRPPPLRSGD
jgi:hypothetical protein